MWGFVKNAYSPRRDHADCSGCSLCLPVCPVWRKTRDFSMTPQGRAKALQHGDEVDAISVENCTLCMACNPVCPENIDLVGMILNLRSKQVPLPTNQELRANMAERAAHPHTLHASSSMMLLPDAALQAHPETLARITNLLGAKRIIVSKNDGADISLALEAGADILVQRLEHFLAPLRRMKKIIVADGLLLRHLKQWLPKISIISVGEVLSSHSNVRRSLRASDLYVIEPRAYHSDYQRLVKHYDRLRANHGCAFNLDLQRIAIPATARSLPQRLGLMAHDDEEHARWILQGRSITRIVAESMGECAALEKVCDIPVMHLADLAAV